jgi:hypothetical protein
MNDFDPNGYFTGLTNKQAEASLEPLPFSGLQKSIPNKASILDSTQKRKQQVLANAVEQKKIELNRVAATFGVASNRLVESIGTITNSDTLRGIGKEGIDYFEKRKPWQQTEAVADRQEFINQQDNEWAKAGAAIWGTLEDPRLLGDLVVEQIPNLVVGGAAGRGAGLIATKAATPVALGTASTLQGADVAGSVYDDLLNLPDQIWEQNSEYQTLKNELGAEQAKKKISRSKSVKAGMIAAGLSLTTMVIPGAALPEKVLAGSSKKLTNSLGANFVKGALGEGVQEATEEGSGQFIGNVAKSTVDPSQSLTEGIGESAGLGALGGIVLGGGAGGIQTDVSEQEGVAFGNVGDQEAQTKLAEEALKSGDISGLTDPAKPANFNPVRAADVLLKRSKDKELTEEDRAKAQEDLDALVTGLQSSLENQTAKAKDPTLHVQEIQNDIDSIDAEIAQQEADGVDTQPAKDYRDFLLEAKAEVEGSLDRYQKSSEIGAKNTQKHIDNIKRLQEQTLADTRASESDKVADLVETVKSPDATPERAQAAEQVIELAIRDPESFDEATVKEFSTNSAFTPEQQNLFKAFSNTHAVTNSLKNLDEVQSESFFGSEGFKGLNEYRATIAKAFSNGDSSTVSAELDKLKAFQIHHDGKKAKIQEALDRLGDRTKGAIHVVQDPDTESGWKLTGKKPWKDNTERSRNGGFTVGASPKQRAAATQLLQLMGAVSEEIKAVQGVVEQSATKPEEDVRQASPVGEAPEPSVQETTSSINNEQDSTVDEIQEEIAPEQGTEPTTPTTADIPVTEQSEAQAEPEAEEAATQGLEEETTNIETGKLSLLKANVKELVSGLIPAADFKVTNLIEAYFRQTGGKAKVPNPLVAQKDFMSLLRQTDDPIALLQKYLPEGELRTQEQASLFYSFSKFFDQHRGNIEANIKNPRQVKKKSGEVKEEFTNPDFWHRDFIQFVRGQHPSYGENPAAESSEFILEENIVTAIAAAGFSYLGDNANGYGLNTDKQINAMLGRDENTAIQPSEEIFRTVGTRANLIVPDLGKRVAQALGLKAAKGAPEHLQLQLENSLGAHVMAFMQQAGLLVEHRVVLPEVQIQADINNTRANPTVFLAIARDESGNLIPEVEETSKLFKGTNSLFPKLFSFDGGLVYPVFEPNQFKQTHTSTGREIPSELRKAAEAYANRKWVPKSEITTLINELDSSQVERIAGVMLDDELSTLHEARRNSQEARNDAIRRGIQRLDEFTQEMETVGKDGFYLPPAVWKQQRVGIASNVIDPQQDKYQRHMVAPEEWNTTIDPTTQNQLHDNFLLAVAQGLDIDVDKQRNTTSIEQLKERLQEPVIAKGLEALNAHINGITLTPEQSEDIVAAVQSGGMKTHSLDVLLEYAKYLDAVVLGKSFDTSVMYEVDGVTNGPALTLLQLGALDPNWGKMVGMFTEQETEREYTEYRSEIGASDLYEEIAKTIQVRVNNPKDKWWVKPTDTRDASWRRQKALEQSTATELVNISRNAVKTPIQAFTFGSGTSTATKGMALSNSFGAGIVDNYYKKLEKYASEGNLDKAIVVISQLNMFLDRENRLYTPQNIEEVLTYKYAVTGAMEKDILKHWGNGLGLATEVVLEDTFASAITNRNHIFKAAEAAFMRYNTARDFLIEQRTQALIASGEIAVDAKGNPFQTLPQKELDTIERDLKPLRPTMHTALSQASGELEAGMDLIKDGKEFVDSKSFYDKAYNQVVKFGQPVPDNSGKTKNEFTVRGQRKTLEEPGVTPVVSWIHAMDSAISAMTYKEINSLNVHDANGFALKNLQQGGNKLNENTYKFLTEYSLATEVLATLNRSLEGDKDLVKKYPELGDVLNQLEISDNVDGDQAPVKLDDAFKQRITQRLNAIDAAKRAYLSKVVAVDQYALEEGSYTVPSELRQEVPTESVPDGLESEWPADQQSQWENIPSIMKYMKKVGEKGQDIKSVAKFLATYVAAQEPTPFRKFQRELLQAINTHAFADLPVYYATQGKKVKPASGGNYASYKHSPSGEVGSIVINSPAFKNHAVNDITVLHEMVHSVTSHSIRWAEGKSREEITDPNELATFDAVADLNALLEVAKTHVASEQITDWDYTLTSLDEFVAFGLTNPAFQVEVLSKISLPSSKASELSKASGVRDFIRALAKIFFGTKTSEANTNGMGVLMASAGILIENNNAARKAAVKKGENKTPWVELGIWKDTHDFDSIKVFEALGKSESTRPASPGYTRHLASVLEDVVNTVHQGPIVKTTTEQNGPVTTDDVFLRALQTGELPFASKFTAEMRLTNQEAYVLESVEVTMQEALKNNQSIQKELRGLFRQAKQQLSATDLPKGAYDLLFTPKENEGESDYLSRFVAASLAYQPLFRKLEQLKTPTDTRSIKDQKNLGAAIQVFFSQLLGKLHRLMLKTTEGSSYSSTVKTLAERLVIIEARNKTNLNRELNRAGRIVEKAEQASYAFTDGARKLVEKAGKSSYFKNSRSGLVRGTGALASAIAGDRIVAVADIIKSIRDRHSQARQGLVAETWTEARGEHEGNAAAHAQLILTNNKERDVKHLMVDVAKFISQSFKQELSNEESETMTKVLRTDLAALLDEHGLTGLDQLLSQRHVRKREIKTKQDELTKRLKGLNLSPEKTEQLRRYMLSQGKALAYFMVTGRNTSPNLMMNTWNIVGLANTQEVGTMPVANAEQLNAVLDPLVSLYAMDYLTDVDRTSLTEVLRREANRKDDEPSGFEVVLRYHQMMQKDALENEFDGNPVHMIKGYTQDIYNPHIELVAATKVEGQDLLAAGYTKLTQTALKQDPADPSTDPRDLYVLRGRGLNNTITGFMSYQSQRAKGSVLHGGLTNPLDMESTYQYAKTTNAVVASKKALDINGLFSVQDSWDPSKSRKANYMAPVLNHAGQAVNYRYLMEELTKDDVLERDNRLEKVVGHMAGSALNKQETPLLNTQGVQLLYDQQKAEFAANPERFLDFSPTSPDPVIRERYKLLPDKTKRDIRAIWGSDRMLVRNDIYNIAFGYRKASIGEALEKAFNRDEAGRNEFERFIVKFFETVPLQRVDGEFQPLGRKAAVVLLRGERGWQELVKMVKDIWVIKNLVTLLGNEFSNMSLLWLRGVPPHKIVTGKIAAYRATFDYRNALKERDKLEWTLKMGLLTGQAKIAAEDEIVILNDTLTKNPVHELMEAGMYQTLVEDISAEDDPYSYKSRLGEKIDQWTGADSKRPGVKIARTVAKNILMTHDTTPYKILNQATIMSDFSARYVLHEHNTTRKRNPIGSEESLRIARAAFVNYDVPTHRTLQYLNDAGILPFTKYYLRIQAALIDAVRSAPGRAIAIALGSDYFNTLPTILESSMLLDPLPGSLSAGAAELPGAIDELATIRWAF